MKNQNQQLENDFIKTLSSIALSGLKSEEKMITQTINQEMVFLLSDTIKFIRLGDQSSYKMIMSDIENLLKFFAVALKLAKVSQLDALLVERNLLSLRLAFISEFTKQEKTLSKKMSIEKEGDNNVEDKSFSSSMEKELLDFINSKKQVANIDVFINFRQFNKRSVKRNLSRLVITGKIIRKSEGKKVYYVSKSLII